MVIQTKIYQGENLQEGVKLALRSRLYVSGWGLSGTLKEMRKDGSGVICVGFRDDVPVAVSVAHKNMTQAFVRKSERRKGYGTMVVSEVRGIEETSYHGDGLVGVSDQFWSSIKRKQIW